MNTLILHPVDTLFFRDGRPMGGAHSGHGAAWPLPHVIDSALHAALWRGNLQKDSHGHGENDAYHFGALKTTGPFPVSQPIHGGESTWYFPRPQDAGQPASTRVTHAPSALITPRNSSLARPLRYGVLSSLEPSKDEPEDWWSLAAWSAYLHGSAPAPHFLRDRDIFAMEHAFGIAIDPATGATGQGDAEGKIYSAQYLRLKEDREQRWALGVLAACPDKGPGYGTASDNRTQSDLLHKLLSKTNGQNTIVTGGQQRLCSVEFQPSRTNPSASLPLPAGLLSGFSTAKIDGEDRWLVKWILLTPALWPEIPDKDKHGNSMTPHPGGWLPNWVFADWDAEKQTIRDHKDNGTVLLKLRTGNMRRRFDSGRGKHVRVADSEIATNARLVAAITPKPLVVTGWSVHHEAAGHQEGAKHTHLAVPAGSVYYFEADSETDAQNLAAALNWHGSDTSASTIRNRRSTLMGEKGFGLGVCGSWDFHSESLETKN